MHDQEPWARQPKPQRLPRAAITVLRQGAKRKGERVQVNIATLERAAERLGNAKGERPLLGRLRYLRGMNFPSPVEKGRGTKAILGLDETMQMLFAFEMMNAGVSPTRTVRILRTDWATVKSAIAYGWARANALGSTSRPHRWLTIRPSILNEIGGEDRADEPLHEIIGVMTHDDISADLERGAAPRRLLMIDTQAFVVALAELADPVLGIPPPEFAEEMRLLCETMFKSKVPADWDIAAKTKV